MSVFFLTIFQKPDTYILNFTFYIWIYAVLWRAVYFIDHVPVFQMSCGKEILSTLLGTKILTALPGCLKTPMVLFWFKAVRFIILFYFFLFFSVCDVNMFLNSILEIALQFPLQLKWFLWVIGKMLWVVKCLYKYCDKKMSITHPVHFIPVFAANIPVMLPSCQSLRCMCSFPAVWG